MSVGDLDAAVVTRPVGPVRVLQLNRPERLNAIDREMALQLQAALRDVAQDAGCRCVLLTGKGRAFCAGQALPGPGEDELPRDIAGLIRERYLPIVLSLHRLEVPVVAAVNGLATGAGFSLALAADLRIAAESAWFSSGFERIGLVPDAGATYFLPRLLGLSKALEVVLLGERLAATAALDLGLVAQVLPDAGFEAAAIGFAERLGAGPTKAFAGSKRAIWSSLSASIEDQLELEATLQQASSETHDFSEGLASFGAGRRPHFTGN